MLLNCATIAQQPYIFYRAAHIYDFFTFILMWEYFIIGISYAIFSCCVVIALTKYIINRDTIYINIYNLRPIVYHAVSNVFGAADGATARYITWHWSINFISSWYDLNIYSCCSYHFFCSKMFADEFIFCKCKQRCARRVIVQ